MIKAEILADSKNPYGDRLTTMLVTFPRIILSEFNTHRMFSRNSASSRAIPFAKMIKSIEENPFIPIAWQKDHKGMQGTEYFTDPKDIQREIEYWLEDKDYAILSAKRRGERGVTKQITNRPLEAYMWHTVVVSSVEWENFFALRCPQYWLGNPMDVRKARSRKDAIKYINEYGFAPVTKAFDTWSDTDWLKVNQGQAEIHMMALAEAMWDAYCDSKPVELQAGEWHIPYRERINNLKTTPDGDLTVKDLYIGEESWSLSKYTEDIVVPISTMMNARTSYTVVGEDGKEWTSEKYLEGCRKLKEANPFHASPFEHCAIVPTEEQYKGGLCDVKFLGGDEGGTPIYDYGWFANFKGFIPYRKMFKNENIKV